MVGVTRTLLLASLLAVATACAVWRPSSAPAPAAPEEVFALACAHCHATGVPGVPRAGVPQDWNARDTRDFEVLLARTISGYGNMPPLGSCSWCSESQLRGAIALMVAGSEIDAPRRGGGR